MKTRRILSLLLALCLTASLPAGAHAAQPAGDPAVSADAAGGPGGTDAAESPETPENPDAAEGQDGEENPSGAADPNGAEGPNGAADPNGAEDQEGASLLDENSGEAGGGKADLTLPQQENWSFTIEAGADTFVCDYHANTMTINGEPTELSGTDGLWTGTEAGVTVRVKGVGDEYPDVLLHGANLGKLHIHLENMPRFAVRLDGESTINYTPAAAENGNVADRAPALWITTGGRYADVAVLPGADDAADATGALTIRSAGQSIRLDGDSGSVLRLEGAVTVNAGYTGTSTAGRTEENIWDGDFFGQATQYGGVRIFGDLQVTGGAKLNVSAFYLPLEVYGVLAASGADAVVTAGARTEEPCRETIDAYRLECSEGARIQALPQEGAQTPAQISLRGNSVIVGENSVVETQSLTVDAEIQADTNGTPTGLVPAQLDVTGGGQLIVHPTAMGVEAVRDGNDQPMEGRICVLAAPGLSINGGSTVNVENSGSILANNWIDRTGGSSYTEGCINAIDLWNGVRDGLTPKETTTLRVGPGGRVDVSVELSLGRGVQLWNDAQVLLEGGSVDLRLQRPDTWGMCLGKDEDSKVSPTLTIHSNWLNIWDEYPYTTPEDVELQPTPYAGGLAIESGTVTVDAGWNEDDPNRPDDPITNYPGGISVNVEAPFALLVAEDSVLNLHAGEVNVNGRCEYIYIPGAVEVNGTVNMAGGILRANGVRRGLVIEGGDAARFNISGGEVIACTNENQEAVSWCPNALVLGNGVAAYDGARDPVQVQQREPNEGETGAEPLCCYPLSYVRITNHPEYSADDNNLGPEDRWLRLSIAGENGKEWMWEYRNGHVADGKGNPMDKNAYGAPPAGVKLNWYDAAQEDGTIRINDPPVLTLNGVTLQHIQIEAENVGSVTIDLVGASTLTGGAQPGMPALTLNGGVDYILNSSAANGGTLTVSTQRQAVNASLYSLWEGHGSLTVNGVTLDIAYNGKAPEQNAVDEAYWSNPCALGGMWTGGGDLIVENGGKIQASAYGTPLQAENCTVTGSGSKLTVKMLHTGSDPDFFALDLCRLEILDGGSVTVDAFGGMKTPVTGGTPVSVLLRGAGSQVVNGTLTAETLHIHGLEIEPEPGQRTTQPGKLTVGSGGQVNLTPLLLQRTWEDENGQTKQEWNGIHGVMLFEGSTLEIAGGSLTLTEDVPASASGIEDGFNTGINALDPGCGVDMSAGTLNITVSGGSYNNGIRLEHGSVLRQTGGEISITANGPGVEAVGSTVSFTGGTLSALTGRAENPAFVLREGRVTEDSLSTGSELEISGTAQVALKTGKDAVSTLQVGEERAAPALLVGDGGAGSMLIVQGGTLTAEGGEGITVEHNSQAWFLGGTTTAKGRFRTKQENPEQLNIYSSFDSSQGDWVGNSIGVLGEIHLGAGVFAQDGQKISAQLDSGYGWNFFAPVYFDTGSTKDGAGYTYGTMTVVLGAEAGTPLYSEALEITSGPVTAGVPFTVRAIYTGVTGNVTFTLPQGVTYRAGSLTVNAQQVPPTLNSSDNSLTVSLTDGGTIRFSAVAGSPTGVDSYEITTLTAVPGAQPGSLQFKVSPLVLELPSATARKTITVSGAAAEGTMVIYEVSGQRVELGRVSVSALGAWRTAIDLTQVVAGGEQMLKIQGVLLDQQENEIASTEIFILHYRPGNVEVQSLTITNEIHGAVPGTTVRNEVVANFEDNTRTPSYLIYWPELPELHFRVRFAANAEINRVKSVTVVMTDRLGGETRVELVRDGQEWTDKDGVIPDSQLFPEQYRLEWIVTGEAGDEDETVTGPNTRIPVSRDPSGYVYEGIPSNRLDGVTTTLYYSNSAAKPAGNATEAMKWDAAAFDQENPLTTDLLGQYQWMVPDGWWQVKYEKDGYETAWSQWLPVPPVQTEVNMAMVPKSPQPAQLTSVTLEGKVLTLVFDRPVSAAESAGAAVTVLAGDKSLTGTLLAVNAEKVPGAALQDVSGEAYYATVFRYALKEAPPEGATLTVASTLATIDGKTGTASGKVEVPMPAYELNCQLDGDTAVVTAKVDTGRRLMLAAAAYDRNGRQLALRTMEQTGAYEYGCTLRLPDDAAYVRAFALDENGYTPFGGGARWELTALQSR